MLLECFNDVLHRQQIALYLYFMSWVAFIKCTYFASWIFSVCSPLYPQLLSSSNELQWSNHANVPSYSHGLWFSFKTCHKPFCVLFVRLHVIIHDDSVNCCCWHAHWSISLTTNCTTCEIWYTFIADLYFFITSCSS